MSRYGLVVTTGPVAEPVTVFEARLHLRVTDGTETLLTSGGVAVDETGGIVSLPKVAHGLSQSGGTRIIVSGTASYDGIRTTTSDTTADKIAFTETYVAETINDTSYVHSGGAEDEMIYSLIIAARKMCEQWQNRAYLTQTLTLTLDGFPQVIEPPRPDLITVTTLKYYDTGGTQRTLVEDTDYTVDIQSVPGRIYPVYSLIWPAVRNMRNSVEVIYTTGYGATRASTPETAKQAMLLLLAHWFENREEVLIMGAPKKLPQGAISLLAIDRVFI